MKRAQASWVRRPRRNSRRGQALLEVGVLGSILLFALATLVRVGLRFNYEQQLQQDTFRKALRVAEFNDTESKTVGHYGYTWLEDRQVPNPSDPVALNARTRFGSDADVIYGRHLFEPGTDDKRIGRIVIRVNGQKKSYRDDELADPDDTDPSDNPPLIKDTVRQTTTPATGEIVRTETGRRIQTQRTTNLTEGVATTLNTRNGTVTLNSTFDKQAGVLWDTP